MIQPYDQTKFLKSLTPAQLSNLESNAEKYVLEKHYKHTREHIQHYAETQLRKRGNKKILYAWALLNWTCKCGWTESEWEEWADMVIGWTKG